MARSKRLRRRPIHGHPSRRWRGLPADGGPAALRFVVVNDWPAPLPSRVSPGLASEEPGAPSGGGDPTAGSEGDGKVASAVAPGSVPHRSTTITAESKPGGAHDTTRIVGGYPLLLTAELVLDYLEDLPRGDGPEAPRFKPAMPGAGQPPARRHFRPHHDAVQLHSFGSDSRDRHAAGAGGRARARIWRVGLRPVRRAPARRGAGSGRTRRRFRRPVCSGRTGGHLGDGRRSLLGAEVEARAPPARGPRAARAGGACCLPAPVRPLSLECGDRTAAERDYARLLHVNTPGQAKRDAVLDLAQFYTEAGDVQKAISASRNSG